MKVKPWQFLLVSTLILAGILAFHAAFLARQDELRELEQEREQQLQQLREMREQLEDASERLQELETMLLNLQRMELLVSGAPEALSPNRGGHQYTATTMPLLSPSGFSPARFERAFAGTGMAGLGESLCLAEKETGVNALVLAGVIALESGWGSSKIARDKNNLAGLGAYDDCPGSAIRFGSREECVMYLARLLRDKPGDNLREIGIWYASDPRWAVKVAACMRVIIQRTEVKNQCRATL